MRRVALRMPPIGHLYDYAMQQARENHENAAAVAALTAEHAAAVAALTAEHAAAVAALTAEHAAAVAARSANEAHLLSELAAAAEERDALELQLYVLRSDHQRAAVRNQELSLALRAAEDRAMAVRADEDRAMAAERAGVTPNDLSVLYAKLAGRMTLLSSEIVRLQPISTSGTVGLTLYLDLLERALTGMLSKDGSIAPWSKGYDPETRMIGRDWPSTAQTMIGLARMRNLRMLTERVVQDKVPGDMLEAGVWRGGACILMRGILAAYGLTDRTVWVADSFAGLPPADPATYPADTGDPHSTFDALCVSSEEVQENFERYGLLDRQVRFLKGWFCDTLPVAPIAELAILRLDGDMYSSTIQTLDALYDKVAQGGYVIVDDYILSGCRQAVDDFRDRHGIHDELNDIDGAAVFWRKS
jgi:hypothetical protein